MIHNILILRRSGEKLFNQNFGKVAWNEILTSGFISALFNFTKDVFDADIQDLELGPYRLMFENSQEDFIIVAIFDKNDSIIKVKKDLDELKEELNLNYKDALNKDLCCEDDFAGLNDIVEDIVATRGDTEISEGQRKRYTTILEEFRSNSEILDSDLITSSGVPLTKEWKRDFLNLCLRQIDAFWKSKQYILDQIILSYEGRHLILYKVNKNLVLSALIRRNTPLGLATLMIEEVANKIIKLDFN
jgi:hypothetical protein